MLQPATEQKTRTRREEVFEAPTLSELAREALADCDNNATAAEEYLVNRISTDTKLLRALVRKALEISVATVIDVSIRSQRASAFNSVKVTDTPARYDARKKAMAAATASAVLGIPLTNGLRLADATQADILETAERWETQANTMAVRAKFLRAVAAAIPAGRRCGDVMTEKKAADLLRKVQKNAA